MKDDTASAWLTHPQRWLLCLCLLSAVSLSSTICVADSGSKVSADRICTLYRSSVVDANMRIHIATFNADAEEAYNITIAVYLSGSVCFAARFQYMCEIKNVFDVSDEGTLGRYSGESSWIGEKIAIDRLTGRVIGRVFDNGAATTVQILDPGSSEQSFKLLSVFRGTYIYADFLTVTEYSRTLKKPFVGVKDTKIYSGLCD